LVGNFLVEKDEEQNTGLPESGEEEAGNESGDDIPDDDLKKFENILSKLLGDDPSE
jgi:hypothetical protein